MLDPKLWNYIWACYALTAIVFVGYMLRLHLRTRAAERALAESNDTSARDGRTYNGVSQ